MAVDAPGVRDGGRRTRLLRRGLLEYSPLGRNVVGSVVVLWSAVVARSVALAGFGLGNRVLQTEARVTLIDGLLAVAVLSESRDAA